MKIYFVRHGETEINKGAKVHQPIDTPLAESGRRQARMVGERFQTIPVDVILSSPYPRAKETAEIICDVLGKSHTLLDTLIERRHPSVIAGKAYDDPEAIKVKEILKKNYHDPDFRHSDEENFFDVKNRAFRALADITRHTQENVLVVTHGHFIYMLIGILLFGEELTPHEYLKMTSVFDVKNTGITMCEYNRENSAWKILTINDFAHLG